MEKQVGPRLRHINLRIPRAEYYVLKSVADKLGMQIEDYAVGLLKVQAFKIALDELGQPKEVPAHE